MPPSKEGWLARWSRRKSAAEAREAHSHCPKPDPTDARIDPFEALPTETTEPLEGSVPDLASLDAHSDYSPFLKQGVRPEVRSAALRKLWSSEPTFSQTDGLQDYAGDFTDSATVPPEPIATAFQIGWGIAGQPPDQEGTLHPSQPDQSGDGVSEVSKTNPKPARPAELSQCGEAPAARVGEEKA